jgi:DNA-binding MarR family transcriptional regulator
MDSTLVQIIKVYEAFKANMPQHTEGDNLHQFAAYLNQQIHGESNYEEPVDTENWKNFNRKSLLEMNTAYLGKMARYVDNYCRKNLSETPLSSIDEFTYLIVLMEYPEMSKSDLIQRNSHPITTGTDIIKRLLKKGYISEKTNPEDGRSRLVELTPVGRAAIFQSSNTMNQLAVIGVGVLSNQELIHLLGMLQKLDQFHDKVHQEHKSLDLTEIIEAHSADLIK